jgi:hypothetical protein
VDRFSPVWSKRGDRVNHVFVFERSCGEFAYRMAGRDPAGAERALGQIGNAHRRGSYLAVARVRMASIDLPRASRLARLIDDPLQRAYALGLMARSVAAASKTVAGHLLEESFDQLEQYRDDRHTLSSAPAVAAALLPVVEQLAPARLQDRPPKGSFPRRGNAR